MGRLQRLINIADLLQGFVSILVDGLDELSDEELAELRAAALAYEPTDSETAGAKAIILWELDHRG